MNEIRKFYILWCALASMICAQTAFGFTTCCDSWLEGLTVEAEYLYWTTETAQLPFSGDIREGTFPTTLNGYTVDSDSYDLDLKHTKYGYENGFRLSLGYDLCDGWQGNYRYTHFNNDGDKTLGDPGKDTDDVFANLLDRTLVDNAGLNSNFDGGKVDYAHESKRLQYRLHDLELQKPMQCGCFTVTCFGGLRFMSLDQDIKIRYSNLEQRLDPQTEEYVDDLDRYDISMDSDIDGWGLRTGCEVEYPICKTGVKLYGRGAVALMRTKFSLSRRDEAYNTSEMDVEVTKHHHNYHALTPNVECAIGLSYDCGPLTFSAGYEFSHWINVYQHFDFPGWDDVDDETAQTRVTSGDISFDGWVVRMGATF